MYERTKEYSLLSMVGLSAAEVSINAVVVAAKVTYTSLPSSGVMGKVKEGFEEKGKSVRWGFWSSSRSSETAGRIVRLC